MYDSSPVLMQGKTVLITGASGGLGFVTARRLAHMGAEVVLACRDARKGTDARDRIAGVANGPTPTLFQADLAVQADVHALADQVLSRFPRLDVLINNAGAVFDRRQLTVDGIERTVAVNHLAPFLLTNLLLEPLQAAPAGRVVTVTSEAHSRRFDLDDVQFEHGYQFLRAYATTKTANLLFTYELARRLERTRVTANAVSPGPSRTGFGDNLTGLRGVFPKVMKRMPFFHTAERGAETIVYVASAPELIDVSGRFYQDRRERRSKPITYDTAVAAGLWQLSEQLCGLQHPAGHKPRTT